MPRAQDIVDELPRLLQEISGMTSEMVPSPSGIASAIRLGGRVLVVEAKANARTGVLAEAARTLIRRAREYGPDAVPLLAVPYMGEAGRRVCAELDVAYIDLSGNAQIKAPPLVIHVQGRPNRFRERGRPSSVFAPKSSRVARLLLLDPGRWWRQRQLAEEGDLGAGYVSRICARLEGDHLIERNADGALRPRDAGLLLRAWESEYRFDKHEIRRGHVSARSGDELVERLGPELDRHGVRFALTGLAAACRLAPFAGYRLVSVYVADRIDEGLLESMRWHEDSSGANVWLVRPNDDGVFQGASDVDGLTCVSAVQAYLDLGGMPERSNEAATHLRQERLPWA